MVSLASLAIVGYLRSYRHYTEQGRRMRLAARSLEAVSYRLRSAQSIKLPLPQALSQGPLEYVERSGGPRQLVLEGGHLRLKELDGRGQPQRTVQIGAAEDLGFELRGALLTLTLPIAQQTIPLRTLVPLRGVAR